MANSVPVQRKLVDFIAAASTAVEKAAEAKQHHAKVAAAVQTLVPGVVQALLDNGHILEQEKEACAKVLQDPVRALKLMAKLAGVKKTPQAVTSLGQSDKPPVKQAAATPAAWTKLAQDLGVTA